MHVFHKSLNANFLLKALLCPFESLELRKGDFAAWAYAIKFHTEGITKKSGILESLSEEMKGL